MKFKLNFIIVTFLCLSITAYSSDWFSAITKGDRNLKEVKQMIQVGDVDLLNSRDKEGLSALNIATILPFHEETAKLLIVAGADVNVKYGSSGKTPLMEIAMSEYDYFEIAKLLISAGADVNAKDNETYSTVLIFATSKKKIKLVKLLLKSGADVNAKNKDGFSALCIASLIQNNEIIKILVNAGADEKYAIKKVKKFLNLK